MRAREFVLNLNIVPMIAQYGELKRENCAIFVLLRERIHRLFDFPPLPPPIRMLSSRLPHHLTLHSRVIRTLSSHNSRRWFTLLGLESSRDSTCAAVVGSDGTIHSNVVVKRQLE